MQVLLSYKLFKQMMMMMIIIIMQRLTRHVSDDESQANSIAYPHTVIRAALPWLLWQRMTSC